MNKILIILTLIVLSYVNGISQINEGGMPYSLQNEAVNTSGRSAFKTTNVILKEVSNEFHSNRAKKLMEECETCRKDYYGTGIDVKINLIKDGSLQDLGDNGKIWLTTVSSKNAFGMQFYFNRYKLPDGAKLFLYNEDKSMILGAFTSRNNHEDGKFATQVISGQKIVIEYFEPKNVDSRGELEIYKVIHAFKEVYPNYRTNYYGESGDCNIDINCPDGANYQDIKGGVCRISYYDNSLELTAHCTGSLLNTTRSALSRQGVILTANHCVTPYDMNNPSVVNHKKYRVAEWIFEFGYEIADCNNPMDPFVITKTMNGASIISKGALSDYALLDLGSTPPPSYNVVYLGWDRDYSSVPSKAVGIHHPSGDVKKVSLENDPLIPVHTQTTAGTPNFNETPGTPFTDWKITWNKGVTEGGSSGSPLFNQDKKIVGQLRGGTSVCPSTFGPDYYGRLAISWSNPDPEYSSWPLSYWLDYNNTGVKSLASYNPNLSTPANCSNGIVDGDETGIDCGGSSCSPCPTQFPSACYNGVKDNGEDGIDCGGACLSCPTSSCSNGIKDGDETGIDCGGNISNCKPCVISTLNPSVVLGNFNYGNECFGECKLTTEAACQNEGWKINHGRALLAYGHDNNHIVLLADPSPNYPNDAEFGTGIYKNYIFEKGKKYLLSFRLLTGKYYSPDYTGEKVFNTIRKFEIRLTNSIVGNICKANTGFNYDSYYAANVLNEREYYYDLQAQVIFASESNEYKNDFNEGKDWQTIVTEFTPDADYSQIWLINAPYSIGQSSLNDDTEWLRIDDIVLFDRDTFFNPCCENEKTISSTSNILLNPSANYLVNVSAGTGSINLESNQSASIAAQKIVLNPGFRAMEGSTFTARAGFCPKNVLFNTESPPFPAGTKPYGVLKETSITTNSFLEACMLPQNRALKEDPEFGKVFMDEDQSEEINTEDQISISPNPTQGNFTIEASFEQEANTVEISVISLSGNTIFSRRYNSVGYLMQEIDIVQFPQGVYLIRVIKDNKTVYRKVVKI